MAHIGDELRLVLTGDPELLAGLLDLVEEPRVLNGNGRLVGERLHQIDDWTGERAGRAAAHNERADHLILVEQWYREQCAHA